VSALAGWDESRCCCHGPDARECFRSRYSVDPDHYGDDEHDGKFECVCHHEYEEYCLEMEDADL